MGHLQDLVLVLFLGYMLYGFYYEYFARVNKMKDEDIIPKYVALVRIKNKSIKK